MILYLIWMDIINMRYPNVCGREKKYQIFINYLKIIILSLFQLVRYLIKVDKFLNNNKNLFVVIKVWKV